jgi:hypothetical protein
VVISRQKNMGGWFAAHSVLVLTVHYSHIWKKEVVLAALSHFYCGKAACFRKPGNLTFKGLTALLHPSPLSNYLRDAPEAFPQPEENF